MRILWITNFPLPLVQKTLNITRNPKEGWLVQLSGSLAKQPNLDLCILSPSEDISKTDDRFVENIRFITYPQKLFRSKKILNFYKNINEIFKPDIVHIQGSENSYGLQWIEACGKERTVVSIQGMPSVYSRYVLGGVSLFSWLRYTTLGDLCRFGNVIRDQQKMVKRGKQECSLLQKAEHVIGRTEWDKAHCWAINPNLKYHFCNETLRQSFYTSIWSFEKCVKYSIFLPQATVPLKGAHKVLEACAIVKKFFPEVKIVIPQCVNLKKSTFFDRLKRRNYGKYFEHLLKKFNLEKNLIVRGALTEVEMLNEYLKCNVFISPACIENSPNSLGEAQILGVPTIASFVGGTDVIADYGKATPLYRYEEIEILAYKIVQLFKNGPNYDQLNYARQLAFKRHNLETNTDALCKIYSQIAATSC